MDTLNTQTDLKGEHSFILFYLVFYVADSATFLDSKQCSGDFIFLLRTARLFSNGQNKYL